MSFLNDRITVIGLGYVGFPLAVEFAKKYLVIGYDNNKNRVKELYDGYDKTNSVDLSKQNNYIKTDFLDLEDSSSGLFMTDKLDFIKESNIYIVTVPTPITKEFKPDLSFLFSACDIISKVLKVGDIVILESTVYPGCTEEDCVPILEKGSNLKYNKDFYCGYSPERINPGDVNNTLTNIKKVTSGSTPEIAIRVDYLYKSIIKAGTFLVSNIKIAEASKSIENAQRDVNISFVNELAFIFDKMDIDTNEVLEAASTKWNFLPFRPGLVGGHCIGVDPYYLAYKSQQLGYTPDVILSGRNVNNNIPDLIFNKILRIVNKKEFSLFQSNVLILGITFKENCSDIRNTKVVDIYDKFISVGAIVDVYDPYAIKEDVKREFNIDLEDHYMNKQYSIIILAVGHDNFKDINFKKFKKLDSIIFDTRSFLPKDIVDGRL